MRFADLGIHTALRHALDTLETAYNKIGGDLDHFPARKVPVLIYTRTDYRTVTNSPDWSGGLYDGKIRLPLGGASAVDDLLTALLFHEYTHVVVHDITSGNCPLWLNEGLAELQGRRYYNPPLHSLEKGVREKSLLPLSTLEKSFSSLPARDASLAYQQSYSMVSYLVTTYGWHKVKEILVNLGKGINTAAAVAAGLSDFSVDYQGFYREWLASVEKSYTR